MSQITKTATNIAGTALSIGTGVTRQALGLLQRARHRDDAPKVEPTPVPVAAAPSAPKTPAKPRATNPRTTAAARKPRAKPAAARAKPASAPAKPEKSPVEKAAAGEGRTAAPLGSTD
jgi:hypothetical protein